MKSFLRHVQLFCELPFPYQESLVERTKEFVRKGKLNNISSIHNWIIKNSVASWAGNKAFTWSNIGCKSLMCAVYPAWIGARSIMKFAFDGVFIRLCGSFGIVINVLSLSTWTSALSNNKSWNRVVNFHFMLGNYRHESYFSCSVRGRWKSEWIAIESFEFNRLRAQSTDEMKRKLIPNCVWMSSAWSLISLNNHLRARSN